MRVLVLDSTLQVSARAQQVLASAGTSLTFAGSASEFAVILGTHPAYDLIVVNLAGDLSGWEIGAELRRLRYQGRVLAFVDNVASPDAGHMRQSAGTECVVRPESAARLDEILSAAVHVLRRTSEGQTTPAPSAGIVGKSKQMKDIFARIEKVATGDANVCIYGESGTGKELIAYAIHSASSRRDRPFVPLDCTAIPEGLMESHLFGHVKGAFTGAVDHRDGVFSLAHTGTLFIDELCELSLPLQAKLLRVIQTREFYRVGGTKPIRSDVRLITATNRDPKQEVDAGRFREDLYYRVAVVMLRVPPLRERRDDIPLLVEHFITRFSTVYKKCIRGIEPVAMDRLMSAPWPGNVRQLENLLEQAVVLADRDTLTEDDLFGEEGPAAATKTAMQLELGLPLEEVERRYILRTLEAARGNRTETARRLRISLRCLQYKLRAYLGGDATMPLTHGDAISAAPSARAIPRVTR